MSSSFSIQLADYFPAFDLNRGADPAYVQSYNQQDKAGRQRLGDELRRRGLIPQLASPAPALEVEAGRLPPPAQAAEAAAQTPLNAPQQAMAIGEPVPVVFARRRNDVGGVMLFPKATEAAFSNTSTQQTARYHCVLGVGPMGSIQTRDFRVGACRVGTFSQNYDKRAGTWTPGNTATPQAGYQVPTFPSACGGGGNYDGLATLEFSSTTTGGSDDWRLGCNVFAREGLIVTRLLDNVSGASDNLADLILWALRRSSRVPAPMIDTASFVAAARFLDVNGLLCNAEFTESGNLLDFMTRLLPYFLLRQTRIAGKYGLRPLVPVNSDGTVNANTLAPDWVLTESVILPGSFSQEWSDAGTRLGPRLAMLWRQQDDTNLPIVRTLHVGLDRGGPAEQHDLSQFCAAELHAARVGAYLHGRRTLSTHTAALTLLPGTHTGRIEQGHVVAVYLPLTTDREAPGMIREWYSVESVTPAADGSEALALAHFPVDELARSQLARLVLGAPAPGALLPYPQIGACDVPGRSVNQSVPASTTSGTPFSEGGSGMTPGDYDYEYNAGSVGQGGSDARFGADGYDGYSMPNLAPDSPREDAPEDKPPVNPAQPGKLPKPKSKPANPAPDAYNDVCPNGTQTVTIRVHHAAFGFGSASPTYTDIQTQWGIISTANIPAADDSVVINKLYYIEPDGDIVDGVIYFSTRVVSNPSNPPGYNVDIPLDLETISVRCDTDGQGTPGPTIATRRYTVRPGDTLYDIAGRMLGNPNRWPEIHALNPKIKNPNLIYPGDVLKLPNS